MSWVKPILIAAGIIFCIGIVATGGVLCWLSTIKKTCADWETHKPYYPWYDCGASNLNVFDNCKTKCYCVNLAFDYKCIDDLPSGVSISYICGGLACIIAGLVGIGYIVIKFVF